MMARVMVPGLAVSSAKTRSVALPRARGPTTWQPRLATGAAPARRSQRCRAGSTRAAWGAARRPAPKTPIVRRKPTALPAFARTRRPTARLARATARAVLVRASTACAVRTAVPAPAKLVHKPRLAKIRDAACQCRPRKIPTTSAGWTRVTAAVRTARATAAGNVACEPWARPAATLRAAVAP